jgi:hypothetical protein
MDSAAGNDLQTVERAKYKLRQANIALSYLRLMPAEIAADLRKARAVCNPDPRLDTFFFSCLGLAQSAFYIMQDGQRGRYKTVIRDWRSKRLDQTGRAQFNRMMALRDNDVHHGRSEGKALATLIPVVRSTIEDAWMYQQSPNYAALGITRPVTEHKNPDGSIVSSFDGLQGSIGLYVEVAGEICEASNACERFITQLTQMIEYCMD